MYELLNTFLNRPEPFARQSVKDLWTREHIAQKMLQSHLDPESDRASRRQETILQSAEWIDEQVSLTGKKLCDLGCGPGLYTSEFSARGALVTGVDFSMNSIQYANESANKSGQSIDYLCADYLEDDLPDGFDVVTLIYCDYCVLSPALRQKLLERIKAMLTPQGKLIMDVGATQQFLELQPETLVEKDLGQGFWSSNNYIGVKISEKFEQNLLALDRFLIIEEHDIWEICNWFQYFSPQSVEEELNAAGFEVLAKAGSLTGTPLEPESSEIALVTRKMAIDESFS